MLRPITLNMYGIPTNQNQLVQKEKSRQIFGVLEKNANFAHAIRQWPWIIARKFGGVAETTSLLN